ncbi:RagB/SusD family nutrient uptake outer membrane protein [Chitinophaga japonensis]|uniref:SusD-like starch-binding protein associating with outer membrane n=1 Tax=Chitinophaga japonensis TaxID=104662 RepID=A0A562T439_CHIJA|nr:RagB/SusD family nutrient uptake outer membrane protein [Chitinophaga japonensis]TWI87780.1 SusD-like starch-binding protein associating with outer membrane [Chitinophaga japonensis]
MNLLNKIQHRYTLLASLLLLHGTSCKKLVEVNPPITSINSENVWSSDATAISVLTGIYTDISRWGILSIGRITSLSVFPGLSADEFTLFEGSPNQAYNAYFKNSLSTSTGGYEYWSNIYPLIFKCNTAIEGLSSSTSLSPAIRQQLLGEAKFLRAFFYFYLLNLYGDAPLALTSDYTENSTLSRVPKSQLYQQITLDLTDAQNLLADGYISGDGISTTEERVRPNKWAATALLARVFLYTGEYAKAELQATDLINNTSQYGLESLDNVFLKNSKEAIWQLQPVNTGRNTEEGWAFILPSTGPNNSRPLYLSTSLLQNFEVDDQRLASWVNSITVNGNIFHYPYKYKSAVLNDPVTEYSTVLRLAEQYLIRSEARAQLDKIPDSVEDLNLIRTRAGLLGTTANTKETILKEILHEKQVELFSEWGHRWLDLKRTSMIDEIMSTETALKGGVWNTNWQRYPIPPTDIATNPNMVQNEGY